MTIIIAGEEQVVCDCTGDSPLEYQDKLLVGIIDDKSKHRVIVQIHCPKCKACQDFVINVALTLQ